MYCKEPSLYEVDYEWQAFEWIDFHDTDNSVIAFLRHARDRNDHLVVVCNFTPLPRHGYRIGVPESCFYREILNTDAKDYGGSGVVSAPGCQAVAQPWQSQPCHIQLTLPPLGVVFLKPERAGGTREQS
jgi:1,4-alpha-glucan branching enzyme